MKLNWGSGIAIFYSIFVLVLVFAVFKSRNYDHSLVSDQYYADDLKYQEHYDKLVNANLLEEDLKIWNKKQKGGIELQFPKELQNVGGEIHLFCPSDSKSDLRMTIQPDTENIQFVPTEGMRKGLWKVKVDWTAENKAYYKEEVITI